MDWVIFDVSLVSFVALVISLMIAPERRRNPALQSLAILRNPDNSFAIAIGPDAMPGNWLSVSGLREGTIGLGFIDRINVQLAAPQSNLTLNQTDFYDGTSAFTWGVNVGALFRVAEQMDISAQMGLRHVSGLSEVDQLAGTGLEDLNNDSARLTFPIVVGVRFRFK